MIATDGDDPVSSMSARRKPSIERATSCEMCRWHVDMTGKKSVGEAMWRCSIMHTKQGRGLHQLLYILL